MAILEFRGKFYRVSFYFSGKRFAHSLKTADEREALGCVARLEENLPLVERGRLAPPPGCHLPTFLLSGGRIAEAPRPLTTAATTTTPPPPWVNPDQASAVQRRMAVGAIDARRRP